MIPWYLMRVFTIYNRILKEAFVFVTKDTKSLKNEKEKKKSYFFSGRWDLHSYNRISFFSSKFLFLFDRFFFSSKLIRINLKPCYLLNKGPLPSWTANGYIYKTVISSEPNQNNLKNDHQTKNDRSNLQLT